MTFEIGKMGSYKVWQALVPREILKVEAQEIEIKCMMRVGPEANRFTWPEKDDISWFKIEDVVCNVVCTVDPPISISNRAFGLNQKVVERMKKYFL